MKTPIQTVWSCAAIISLLVTGLSPVCRAATDFWSGNGTPDGNWQNGSNWGGAAPNANDLLDFTGSTQLLTTNNFTAGTVFNGITFDSLAQTFTLSGNSLVLTNGTDAGGGNVAGGSITNNSASAQTNLIPITVSAGKHQIFNLGLGKLNLNGAITRSTGTVIVFTNAAGGIINVAGGLSTNGQNNILGGWATISNDWATLDASSNVVPYAGYVSMSSGAIANTPANNIKFVNDSADLTAANGTVINSIDAQVGAARNVTIAANGTMRLGARGGIYRNGSAVGALTVKASSGSAFLAASGGGEITLSDAPFAATANNITVTALITNDAANAVSVNILGYVALSGANGYSGGTYIDQGRVQAGSVSAFGTGPVTIFPGGQAFLNGSGIFTNNFTISGIGSTETSGGQNLGAIRYGATATNSGTITLAGNARISGASGGNNTLLGKITGPGRLELTGATGNNSSINLSAASGLNDWSGGLLITVGGSSRQAYVRLGANEEIPDGAGKGDVALNCTADIGRLDLNGFNETINGLIGTNGLSANNQVQNNGGNPCTLTLGNNNATATFGGVISDNGNGLSIVKIGTGTETFTGANSYNGTTVVEGGTVALTGSGTFGNNPNITISNATLDVSGETAPFTLTGNTLTLESNATMVLNAVAPPTINIFNVANSTLTLPVPLSPTTNIVTTTLNAGGAANTFNITTLPGIFSYPQQFALIQYVNNTGNAGTFAVGSLPSTYRGYISNDVVNSIIWLVATNGPVAKSVVWNGNVNGNWDTSTPNWQSGLTFNQGDFATFDDTLTGTTNVVLTTALAPFTLTVNNSLSNYVFSGSGKITGTTSLTKNGTGTLLMDNTAGDDFSGQIQIIAGTVQVGNNDANGGLGTGALTNGGTLIFARTDNYINTNAISGTGTINQVGSGISTLAGNNAGLFGPVNVLQGTLKAGSTQALGTNNVTVTVSSGAALDVNGQILTNAIVNIAGTGIAGTGAIISSNSAVGQLNALTNVNLTANATVGGIGRWDIRGANDVLNLNGFTLTKTGTNQVSVVNAIIGAGNIVINQGVMDFETANNGNPFNANGFVSIGAAGVMGLFSNPSGSFHCPIMNGGTIRNLGSTTQAFLDAPITNTANVFLDDNGAAGGLVINGAIAEQGGSFTVTKVNGGTIYLGGQNTYTGPTVITAGALALTNSGTIASSSSITISNATLDASDQTGGFTLSTNVVALTTNATLIVNASYPTTLGTLDMTNSVLQLQVLDFSPLPIYATNLNLGGTSTNIITITTFTATPSVVQFPLIEYTTLGGGFNFGLSTLPAGYAGFISNNVANHSIDLVLTASAAEIIWNGGNSAVDNNWSDAGNWSGTTLLQNNVLDFRSPNGLTNTNDTPAGNNYSGIFFDNGPFVLNGNPITLLPGAGVTNNSGSIETVNIGLSTSGTNIGFAGNSAGLIIGNGVTNTGNAQEYITLNGTGTLTNLLATPAGGDLVLLSSDGSANWTVLDNASSTPMVVSNGGFALLNGATLTFGSATSAPNLTFSNVWNTDNTVGNSSGTSTFNMVNGSLYLPARVNIVGNPGGVVNVSGGTLSMVNQMQIANGAASDIGALNISGGRMNVGAPANNGTLYLASRGTGTGTLSGTGVIVCGKLDVSRNASGTTGSSAGLFNLNGGALITGQVTTMSANSQAGGSPTARFNFNGGRLVASASSATFFQGNVTLTPVTPITTFVEAGGAIIDTTNFNDTVLEPMQYDSTTLAGAPDGGLLKLGSGTLTLTAANTYVGNTVISNGTLAVNGSLGQTLVRALGGTLAGTGSVGSNVLVGVGGSIAPAGVGVIGTLTVASNVTLLGVTAVDVNHTTATCDLLTANTINYGGTLSVTNLSGTLTTNDTFKVFNAASYSGAFAAVVPASPQPGLGWNTNTLATDGTLRLVQTVNVNPTNIIATVSGGTLTLTWPTDHIGWRLLAQTNSLAIGLATNWVTVSGSAATNSEVFTTDPANGTVFYRLVYP